MQKEGIVIWKFRNQFNPMLVRTTKKVAIGLPIGHSDRLPFPTVEIRNYRVQILWLHFPNHGELNKKLEQLRIPNAFGM